jgi:hypothetical protein
VYRVDFFNVDLDVALEEVVALDEIVAKTSGEARVVARDVSGEDFFSGVVDISFR